jgi:hypothetical protein
MVISGGIVTPPLQEEIEAALAEAEPDRMKAPART